MTYSTNTFDDQVQPVPHSDKTLRLIKIIKVLTVLVYVAMPLPIILSLSYNMITSVPIKRERTETDLLSVENQNNSIAIGVISGFISSFTDANSREYIKYFCPNTNGYNSLIAQFSEQKNFINSLASSVQKMPSGEYDVEIISATDFSKTAREIYYLTVDIGDNCIMKGGRVPNVK